jgi:Ca2+-binding EF-hand superfamily protein
LSGNGFSLTSPANGVRFDIAATGSPMQISWTAPGAANAFLVLDRNGNGVIDNGSELFGNITPQAASAHPNGFLALAQYDANGDGVIDASDPVYSQLRLWIDTNHDGVSQAEELHTLSEMGVFSISLDYSLSMRTDEYGNVFRFKAKVNAGMRGASDVGKKAYDVFFVSQ